MYQVLTNKTHIQIIPHLKSFLTKRSHIPLKKKTENKLLIKILALVIGKKGIYIYSFSWWYCNILHIGINNNEGVNKYVDKKEKEERPK